MLLKGSCRKVIAYGFSLSTPLIVLIIFADNRLPVSGVLVQLTDLVAVVSHHAKRRHRYMFSQPVNSPADLTKSAAGVPGTKPVRRRAAHLAPSRFAFLCS